MDRDQLQREVAGQSWFHTIDLGQGVVTPGRVDPRKQTLPRLGLPEDLSGKTVLDIGAWDGFFSFEAERRGAKRVWRPIRMRGGIRSGPSSWREALWAPRSRIATST